MTESAVVEPVVEAVPEPEPEPEQKKSQTRTYNVLREDSATSFSLVGRYEGSDDMQAIKSAVKEHGNDTYVAVAGSAWHRRQPRVELVEVVRWS